MDSVARGYIEKFLSNHEELAKKLNYDKSENRIYNAETNKMGRAGWTKNTPYRQYARQIREESKYTEHAQDPTKFNRNRMLERRGAWGNDNSVVTKGVNWAHAKVVNTLESHDQDAINWEADKFLSRALQAQNYTLETVDGKTVAMKDGKKIDADVLDKLKYDAVQSAKEATYHSTSELAQKINKLKEAKIHGIPVGQILDIRIPFVGTPANVLKRSIEASPYGIYTGIHEMKTKVASGEMSAATALGHLTRGMTGTAAMLVGAFMASIGLISTPDDDDDEKTEYYKENIFGKANYALHFGGKYYSLDWAFPVTAPLLWGASCQSMFEKYVTDKEPLISQDNSVINDFFGTVAPILKASYLENLNSLVEEAAQGYSYGGLVTNGGISGAADRVVTGTAENYIKQFFPSAIGAFNRTIDETKRTTSGKNPAERIYNNFLSSAVPGGSFALQPAIDQKGERMKGVGTVEGHPALSFLTRGLYNFAFPANITTDKHDKYDEVLVRDGGAPLSQNALRKKLGKDYKTMSPKEYTKVKEEYYKSYNTLAKQFLDSDQYATLGQYDKTGVFNALSQQAYTDAKTTYYSGMGNTNDLYTDKQKAAKEMEKLGITNGEYYSLMQDTGLTDKQQAVYVANQYDSIGVLDDVIKGVEEGKYTYEDVGLTKGVAEMTADERFEADLTYIETYGRSLEQAVGEAKLANTSEQHKEIVNARKAERKEVSDSIASEKSGVEKLLQDRATSTGMTKDQYRKYQKIEGLKRETGGTVSYTQQLKVAEAMMKDGTWANYRSAYENGELNQDDLSKIHLNSTFLGWTDDAIEKAIDKMNSGEWVDVSEFKKSYKESTGKAVTGTSSKSTKSSTAKTQAEKDAESARKAMLSAFTKAMSNGSSNSKISASVSGTTADLWDSIVNGNKRDVESLRKELKL